MVDAPLLFVPDFPDFPDPVVPVVPVAPGVPEAVGPFRVELEEESVWLEPVLPELESLEPVESLPVLVAPEGLVLVLLPVAECEVVPAPLAPLVVPDVGEPVVPVPVVPKSPAPLPVPVADEPYGVLAPMLELGLLARLDCESGASLMLAESSGMRLWSVPTPLAGVIASFPFCLLHAVEASPTQTSVAAPQSDRKYIT